MSSSIDKVRSIIREVFSEVSGYKHFSDRVADRLKSKKYTTPPFDYSVIEDEMNILKYLEFPDEAIALRIKKLPTVYRYMDPTTSHDSTGNEIWVIIRNNVIHTIMFRKSAQANEKILGIDRYLDMKSLKKFYLDNVDRVGQTLKLKRKGEGRKKPERRPKLDLPVVRIKNKEWFLDEPNDRVIYVKNIKKHKSIDDLTDAEMTDLLSSLA